MSENAEIQDRNPVFCGSIEHKMGIKGSATAVLNFDGAKGYLIGEPNRGLHAMFTFMNAARIGTALEGLAASESAYQGALMYAKDRLQFRSLTNRTSPDSPADPIIVHPDVRRMLLTQKAFAEGGRVFAYYCMKLVDATKYSDDPEVVKTAESRMAFLTPIIKAFLTETAQESTSYGMQVYGGHGFIKEWGMEQLVRDTRISTMYEGTTGIQALDLLGRKVMGSGGQLLNNFIDEVSAYCESVQAIEQFGGWNKTLQNHLGEWQELTAEIGATAMNNPDEVGAASVDYLMYSGYIVMAYFWLQMAVVSQQKLDEGDSEADFYQAKLHTAKFYFERLFVRTRSLAVSMKSGADNLMSMEVHQF